MSLLKSYLIRKGFSNQTIEQIRKTGSVVVPPDWKNYFVDEQMMFSHRCNRYTDGRQYSMDNQLHAHACYELVVHIRGETEYIHNDKKIHPQPYTVTWCRPGGMHAVRMSACEYERYLMYFSEEFFLQNGEKDSPVLKFTENKDIFAFQIDAGRSHILQSLLEKIEQTLQSDVPYKNLLAKALLVELFAFFNTAELDPYELQYLNDSVSDVKKYIDRNYADISGTQQIADEFHYSREHLSRKFKNRFNTTVAEYLSRRRVIESTYLLTKMSVIQTCYAVGFRNPSVYIAAFKKNMGCLPSEYKRQRLKENNKH